MVYDGDWNTGGVVAICPACGDEIYEKTPVWVVGCVMIHACDSCLKAYVDPDYYPTAKEAVAWLRVCNEERV